jgi:hypothetical protein
MAGVSQGATLLFVAEFRISCETFDIINAEKLYASKKKNRKEISLI